MVSTQDMTQEILDDSHVLETIEEITTEFSNPAITVPWDVRDDLVFLYRKWTFGDFSTDPYRGISSVVTHLEGGGRSVIHSIEPDYEIRDSDFYGNGHLVNGQCWPLRLCMVRDGAHRYQEAGICGNEREGAQAVVMGKPHDPFDPYADRDEGDTIYYVGTAAKARRPMEGDDANDEGDDDGEARTYATKATELLFTSIDTQNDVRVFRSSKLPKVNPYKPPSGFRYDGTYKVVEAQLLGSNRSIYTFKMVRNPNQGPIRLPINEDNEGDSGMDA